MTDRIHNFSAGPAVLPEDVITEARQDIWNIDGSGIGIMEHSHRGKVFDRVLAEAEADCRQIASIPGNYRILFLQGGASTQFMQVPANLLPDGRSADYIDTGSWASKAITEAQFYGDVHVAFSGKEHGYRRLPRAQNLSWSGNPVYVHFTSNNTIHGTQFNEEPVPPDGAYLVCDASSDIFSRPIDVSNTV